MYGNCYHVRKGEGVWTWDLVPLRSLTIMSQMRIKSAHNSKAHDLVISTLTLSHDMFAVCLLQQSSCMQLPTQQPR